MLCQMMNNINRKEKETYQYPVSNIVVSRLWKLPFGKFLLHRKAHGSLVQKPPAQEQHQIVDFTHHWRRRLMDRHDDATAGNSNFLQELYQALSRVGIQPGGWLIQYQQTGTRHKFHAALDAFLLAPAQTARHEHSPPDECIGHMLEAQIIQYFGNNVVDFLITQLLVQSKSSRESNGLSGGARTRNRHVLFNVGYLFTNSNIRRVDGLVIQSYRAAQIKFRRAAHPSRQYFKEG
mmetsp:Transcript_1286/g.2319  ORF Transcript_1286/g.2319 Transcript_1286/m.2319 type:complete len:235 (+) Transcript_1286:1201-1905(+)